MKNIYCWEAAFPKITTHTSIAHLKSRKEFLEAKLGNMHSAMHIVETCVKQAKILYIKNEYPNAVLLPAGSCNCNKLPEALAQKIGLKICTGAQLISSTERKCLTGIERLLHKPIYSGDISANQNYIIVDDVVSQGGTIAALRKFVIDRGGKVCAVVALAHSICDGRVAPTKKNISSLKLQCPQIFNKSFLERYFNISNIRELTNQQIKYLLTFKNTQSIIKKINTCHFKIGTKKHKAV